MTSAQMARRPAAPTEVFVLPELRDPRFRQLGILVLPDGNRRSDPDGSGYDRGARKVIEVAEHLARRPDVAVLVACVLSPENIAARSDAFFASIHRGFARLAADIAERGTLVDAGVRAELCGDLRGLRERGPSAAALAASIEDVIERTRRVEEPRLRLCFGVGYASTTPRDMDIDVLLRTGIEDAAALRLSGLCSHPSIANCALTRLWPDVETRDVDEIIEEAKRGRAPALAKGYGPQVIAEIVRAIARAPLASRARVSLASHARRDVVASALEALFAGASVEQSQVTVELGAEDAAPVRLGARPGSRHEVRVLFGDERSAAHPDTEYAAMLAPGQRAPILVLPDWHYGYATIHACEATPAGIAGGLCAAERFSRAHVALRGAERGAEPASRQLALSEGACR